MIVKTAAWQRRRLAPASALLHRQVRRNLQPVDRRGTLHAHLGFRRPREVRYPPRRELASICSTDIRPRHLREDGAHSAGPASSSACPRRQPDGDTNRTATPATPTPASCVLHREFSVDRVRSWNKWHNLPASPWPANSRRAAGSAPRRRETCSRSWLRRGRVPGLGPTK